MKINFETERLRIRPLTPDDAEMAFRWCGDPKVNTYMIYPLYHRMEDVRTWLETRDADNDTERYCREMENNKFGGISCYS